MSLSYSELLEKYGSRHSVRKAIETGEVVKIAWGRYSLKDEEVSLFDEVSRREDAVVTGHTAYYLLDLTDLEPDAVDVATKRGGTKISSKGIKQVFIPEEWIAVGKTYVEFSGSKVACYDKERMLLELMRNRNKMPFDFYKELVASYRNRANHLDTLRLEEYSKLIPRGESYYRRAMQEVF